MKRLIWVFLMVLAWCPTTWGQNKKEINQQVSDLQELVRTLRESNSELTQQVHKLQEETVLLRRQLNETQEQMEEAKHSQQESERKYKVLQQTMGKRTAQLETELARKSARVEELEEMLSSFLEAEKKGNPEETGKW